jgi:hypothetical protein
MDQTVSTVLDDLEAALRFTAIALGSKRPSSVEKYRLKARERYDRIVTALGDTRPDTGTRIRLMWLAGDLRELGASLPIRAMWMQG